MGWIGNEADNRTAGGETAERDECAPGALRVEATLMS
jgi:hypothetical protein